MLGGQFYNLTTNGRAISVCTTILADTAAVGQRGSSHFSNDNCKLLRGD